MANYHKIHCRDCDTYFSASEKYRLSPGPNVSLACEYEDVCKGTCPQCHQLQYQTIEISFLDDPLIYHYVNPKRHSYWEDRIKTSLKHDITNRKGATTVQGSKRFFPWSYRETIPVLG